MTATSTSGGAASARPAIVDRQNRSNAASSIERNRQASRAPDTRSRPPSTRRRRDHRAAVVHGSDDVASRRQIARDQELGRLQRRCLAGRSQSGGPLEEAFGCLGHELAHRTSFDPLIRQPHDGAFARAHVAIERVHIGFGKAVQAADDDGFQFVEPRIGDCHRPAGARGDSA